MITKGEWKIKHRRAVNGFEIWADDDSTIVADCWDRGDNAHLIAAAPEMYEALRVVLNDYDRYPEHLEYSMAKAKQALNKAEGK